jgi:hypothetical protein
MKALVRGRRLAVALNPERRVKNGSPGSRWPTVAKEGVQHPERGNQGAVPAFQEQKPGPEGQNLVERGLVRLTWRLPFGRDARWHINGLCSAFIGHGMDR